MQFEPIALPHKRQCDSFTSVYGEGSCQHSFVTMFSLYEKYGDAVCFEGESMYVCREHLCTPEYRVYLMPMGPENTRLTVGRLLDDAHSRGARVKLFTATERAASSIEKAYPGRFSFEEIPGYAEYFYRSRKLVDLPGPELAGKRRCIRLFYRDCPGTPEVVPLTPDIFPALLDFHGAWTYANVGPQTPSDLSRDMRNIRRHCEHFEALGLSGFAVKIDGRIRGYLMGVKLSDTVYDGLTIKGDRSVREIYAFMFRELGKLGTGLGCEYINFEEDLGRPGLHESRLSYHPDRMLYKFIVTEA